MEEERIENKQVSEETPVKSPSEDMEAIQPSGEIGIPSEDTEESVPKIEEETTDAEATPAEETSEIEEDSTKEEEKSE